MNVYLIGYRGSGKSTVAPHLADLLGRQHHDTDAQVELLAGTTIAEIFNQYNERTFREWETTVIEAYSFQTNLIVSLGGGAPMIDRNRALIAESGKTVWLTAEPWLLWSRIQADSKTETQRPALTNFEGEQEITELLNIRNPIYAACADYKIDTTDLEPKQIAEHIANWLDPVDK